MIAPDRISAEFSRKEQVLANYILTTSTNFDNGFFVRVEDENTGTWKARLVDSQKEAAILFCRLFGKTECFNWICHNKIIGE